MARPALVGPLVSVKHKGQGRPIPIVVVDRDVVGGRFAPQPESRTWFHDATVSAVNFSGQRFFNFLAGRTLFDRCDFSRVRFASGYLADEPGTIYRDCAFDRADLRSVSPGLARFERCRFDGAKLAGWRTLTAEFVDSIFAARIEDVVFFGRPGGAFANKLAGIRDVNAFTGNDFTRATFSGVDFKAGIDISAQRWPDDPAYVRLDRLQERIRLARTVVRQWPDESEREEALLVLRLYSTQGFEEQNELFARPSDSGAGPGAAKVWDVLRTML